MIHTIGYEGASLNDFIQTLKRSKVSCLIDVRERAQSRRKGFSKSALATALDSEGIRYLHFRELGDPKAGREAARNADYPAFKRIYSKVITASKGQAALRAIVDAAKKQSVCLMCYERDPVTCHRKIITDTIEKETNIKIRHLGVNGIEPKIRSKGRMLHSREGAAAQI